MFGRLVDRKIRDIIRLVPTKHSLKTDKFDESEIEFTPEIFFARDVILQTKNISSIQRFIYERTKRFKDAARDEALKAGFQGVIGLIAAVVAASFLPQYGYAVAGIIAVLAVARAIFAFELYVDSRRRAEKQSRYHVEIYMNSGRRHRFFVRDQDSAMNLVELMVQLITSADRNVRTKFDNSTNQFIIVNNDNSVNVGRSGAIHIMQFESNEDENLEGDD
ncbi:MAG: hypothetical protein QNJ16_08010 [Rhodobacter sp.]|nr:hypothetical protein [Rhodobacter sp.]